MLKVALLSMLFFNNSIPQIRVLIAEGRKMEVRGDVIEVVDPYTYKEMGLYDKRIVLYLTSAGIMVDTTPTLKDYIIIRGKGIAVNGKRYPGRIEAISRNGKIYLINDLDLETYVKGVVASEVPLSWNVEALKAQAVAARTYAYRLIRERRGEFYDLSATVLHQVYSGIEHTTPKVILAVDSTQGEVMFYHGKIIKPYYHSDCGGSTDSSLSIWGINLPYLKSVRCPFPGRKWRKTFSVDDLGRKLRMGKIKRVKILKRSPGGRVLKIKFADGRRERVLSGEDLRRVLGYAELKSAKFKVRKRGEKIEFEGRGSGHGVGMCQWGAERLAEKGYSYDRILKFYYHGIEIKKVY